MENIEIIDVDNLELGPIEKGKGMIAYRKHLWAIKKLNDRLEELTEYKEQVLKDILEAIENKEKQVDYLRETIKEAMLEDEAVQDSPTGGKTLSLPDIASVSVSKPQDKVVIEDPTSLLKLLGDDYAVIKHSLDTSKAKKYLETLKALPEGAHKETVRTLTIKFKD